MFNILTFTTTFMYGVSNIVNYQEKVHLRKQDWWIIWEQRSVIQGHVPCTQWPKGIQFSAA